LVDEVADQAYCKHGIRGLNDRYKDEEDRRCECERPGYTYSGVPGILAHMKYGRLAKGAEVARCDACERYPSDETALKKLRELGLV
jgi:hypothetical protein